MRKNKIAILMVLLTVTVMIVPASAYVAGQNVETKAERLVDIAEQALERVTDLTETIDTNQTIIDLLTDAGLYDYYLGNVSLCEEGGDGLGNLTDAQEALLLAADPEEYEAVIDDAREALEIFRDVLRAINGMLIDVGVETCPTCDPEAIEEAKDRSQERIDSLLALLADQDLRDKLGEAQLNLDAATNELPDNVEAAKEYLKTANELISEVCQDLKTIAQDLNPGRIRSYIARASKNNERVQERFRERLGGQTEINNFLQGLGYTTEEDFWTHFDTLVENAENAKTVKEATKALQDMGKMIQNTEDSLNQKGNGNNQSPGNGNGNGNMGGGNGR